MPTTPAPDVEMLWEANDPAETLRARFGLVDADAAASWVEAVLHAHWGIVVEACERIVMSDSNALAWIDTDHGRLVAKWSVEPARFPRLAALADLTVWLDQQGLPVSAPIAASDGRAQVETDGVSLSLQREVEGDLLDATDAAEVRALGAALAHLHDALAAYPGTASVPVARRASEPLALQLAAWLASAPAHVPVTALDALRGLLAGAPVDALPVQLVHGDVRAANVLCTGREVAAVLDLEELRLDHRVVELARSAVLLGTRFRDWGPVSPEARSALRVGYESVCPLTPSETRWWDVLVLWISCSMVPDGEDPTGWGAALQVQVEMLGPPR